MTERRKPGDEEPVEAWDDEGGASEREAEQPEEGASTEEADRAKRWADEHTGHWHGATSSDETQGRDTKQ